MSHRRPEILGRNAPCPCCSGLKYKQCCANKVPWEQILAANDFPKLVRNISLRGKNLLFLDTVVSILGLGDRGPSLDWESIKSRCTPEAVFQIHHFIASLWPDMSDLTRILTQERPNTTALYTGSYHPETLLQGITRHSLYADRILLFDPFLDGRTVRPQFSPLNHPEKFVSTTLMNLRLWFELSPWIHAGLVSFIRRIDDYDPALRQEFYRKAFERAQNPRIKKALEEEAKDILDKPEMSLLREYAILASPDDAILAMMKTHSPNLSETDRADILKEIDRRRTQHPYVPSSQAARDHDEIMVQTSGASYDECKLVASYTNSHLITSFPTRWLQIEQDREMDHVERGDWTPLAHAFATLPFKFLNAVPLSVALKLRQEERLSNMRAFLHRIWCECNSQGNPMSAQTAKAFADELTERIQGAEEEWKRIDLDLLKRFGGTGAAALLAAGPLVAAGHAAWLGAGVALTGAVNVTVSVVQHHMLQSHPAAFLLDLKRHAADAGHS